VTVADLAACANVGDLAPPAGATLGPPAPVPAGADPAGDEPARQGTGRAALTISAWNAVSRVTGFVRVLAMGAALGATYLGNTFHSANLVSTVTFELLAAGLLSAPLVPAFVSLLDRGRQSEAERLAGTLLGLSLAALGVLALALALAGHGVMRLLTAGVDDPAVRDQQVRLGAFFLWFFLPQLLLYAAGAVATAFLNARRRFAAAAFAPVANNLIVTATMVTFAAVTARSERGLDLALWPKVVLAVGTTAGVLAMAAVPVVALARAGVRLRPRMDLRHPGLPAVVRAGAWGAVLLAAVQILIAVTLVLANRVEGGVVAYQIAFTFFLLPFALVAQPIFTTLHPVLSSSATAGRWGYFDRDLAGGLARTLLLVVPAAALLAALAWPALDLVRLGALDQRDASLVARVLAAYAAGLGGYAAFQLLVRAATAAGQARLAAVVGLGVAGGGTALMLVAVGMAEGDDVVVALGLAHSAALTAGALALLLLLRRRLGLVLPAAAATARAVAAGAGAGLVAAGLAAAVSGSGRLGAAADLAVAGPTGLAAAVAVLWVLRTPELATLRAVVHGRRA
jgi:putative peptidoglycan lipid II flippase